MSIVFALSPDFALIVTGWLLRRFAHLGDAFWLGTEKLVYFVLFPALLFYATATAPLELVRALPLAAGALGVIVAGFLLGALGKWVARPSPVQFASGIQCAFRFNSYIALSAAQQLYGAEGVAATAICIGVAVPTANFLAVWSLARHRETHLVRELVRNPLLVATVAGLAWNALHLALPQPVGLTLSRLGVAATTLGLVTVGAALRFEGLREGAAWTAWVTATKLLALPVFAFFAAPWLGLTGTWRNTLILFAALPTATSAYVLAARMGGDGRLVAVMVSLSTVGAMLTLPLAVALTQ